MFRFLKMFTPKPYSPPLCPCGSGKPIVSGSMVCACQDCIDEYLELEHEQWKRERAAEMEAESLKRAEKKLRLDTFELLKRLHSSDCS